MPLPSLNIEHEEAKKVFESIRDNISLDDLKVGTPASAQPDAKQINSGSFQFAEVSGVPILYYRTTSGDIYKFTGVAV